MIMLPLLTAYVDFLAIFGGFLSESLSSNVTFRLYFSEVISSLTMLDLIPGIGKTAVFGFLIGLIGAYQGFTTSRGTEGVGKAATTSVVLASLNIIFVDMIIIQLSLLLFGSG